MAMETFTVHLLPWIISAACAALAISWLLVLRWNRHRKRRRHLEQKAKKSFRVNRRDLAKIARGEPTNRRKKQRSTLSAQSGLSGHRKNSHSWDVWGWAEGHLLSLIRFSRLPLADGALKKSVVKVTEHSAVAQRDAVDAVAIIGLDCEMVGGGREGNISMLGRCSLVLSFVEKHERGDNGGGDDVKFQTIYDKFVKPRRTVVDYRTKWSGITKDDLKGLGSLPCIPFDVCRSEVASLLASYKGKPVLLVGHALKNDFDVLELRHPFALTRDTSTYRPFMRTGRTEHKVFQRKLSHLVEENLGLSIQDHDGGHSSAEDAEAALKLYWKVRDEWESRLGFPLCSNVVSLSALDSSQPRWPPVTLYLDGCNLPLAIRKNNDSSWQLISKTAAQGNSEVYRQVDWIPILQSVLSSFCAPLIGKVVIMFDGAKYQNGKKQSKKKEPKIPKSIEISKGMFIERTDVGVEVDDVIVDRCCNNDEGQSKIAGNSLSRSNASFGPIVAVEDVVQTLSNLTDMGFGQLDDAENDQLDCYAVIRRKAGGSKTNKKLFEKLNLRRPCEGAHFLGGLTVRLQKNSLQTATELQRARVYNLVEYELRPRQALRNIIVTDDILLTDRLVTANGGINLVLSWRQLQQMF